MRRSSLTRSKAAILGAVFVLVFALYAYSPVLYGFPKGGDAPNALSMIRYLEKWWPHFPRWNTEWGCGYPFLTFYQPLGIVFTFLLSKALNLSIFTAYKLTMLLIVTSASLALYLLSLLLFEDEAAALAVAFLYLSTPGSFNNLIYYGNYTEHFGYPFLIVSMLLLHLYVKSLKRSFLIISIISYALLLLSHSLMAALGTVVLFTYLLWLHFKERVPLTRFIKTSLLFFGFGVSLTAFWYVPFMSFGAFKQYGIVSPKTWGPLSIEQLVGLPGSGFTRLAPWTVLLATVGSFISLKKKTNRFLLLWALIFLFYLEANRFAIFYPLYGGAVSPLRFLPWASIFLSLLGGQAVKFARTRITSKRFLAFMVVSVVALPLAYVQRVEVRGATHHEGTFALMKELSGVVDGRIAFPGYMGQFHQTFNLVSNESQLSNYQLQSAPNLAWIGTADAYLFKGFGGVEEAVAVCRWYGLEYLFLDEGSEAPWATASQYFEETWRGHGYRLFRVVNSTPYASVGDRRKILVVGDRYAYENIFWTLIQTKFDPEVDALVWMDAKVDDLDVEELRNFDIVVLYGYSYRNRDEMMRVLQRYVIEGGSLFIDTGYSPDSETPELTPPFPVTATKAENFGFTWTFTCKSSEILQDVNFTAFAPPRYGDYPWGVSRASNLTLQPWAETLVWLNGYPIIVTGEYGKGEVIWCGLNLPYHAKSYRNREEAKLLLNLLNWLSPPKDKPSCEAEVERSIPEKIVITLDEKVEGDISVFVRETYFPKWKAYLESESKRRRLDLYYSGPGFMLIILPKEIETPAKLIIRYETTKIECVGYAITLITILLAFYATGSKVLRVLRRKSYGSFNFRPFKWFRRVVR